MIYVHSSSSDAFLVGGQLAVQLFYVISGFLISYVLATTPKYASPSAFYVSRALRLYPVYYVVAILTIVARAFQPGQPFFQFYRDIPSGADFLLAASNLLLFGQDWVLFAGVENGHLVFSKNFAISEFVLQKGLLVPQAWTLGVELSFYLIAPLVLRDTRKVLFLLAASIALRVLLILEGTGRHDPWTYRFFPLELALFLLGACSQKFILPRWERVMQSDLARRLRLPVAGTAFLVAFLLLFPYLPWNGNQKGLALIGSFLVLLPLAFLFQNDSRIDKKVGDLSYPMYVGHWLAIGVVTAIAARFGEAGTVRTMASIAASIAFAMVLNAFVASRVEVYRKALKARPARTRPAVAAPPAADPDNAPRRA